MSIFVVRHADRELGDFPSPEVPMSDQPISAVGRKRAERLLEFFKDIEIATIRASKYVRTEQTIKPLAESKGLPVARDPRLNEINVGEAAKLSDEELRAGFPEFWKLYKERRQARVYEAFLELDPGANHIMVAHDGIIRTLVCKVLGLPPHMRHLFRIVFCSITVFDRSAEFGCWTMTRMNG
ncbi:MAG: putative phosphoglycerate mutase [Spirochaetes bacterium]|nr:MAG: putative phosphoglycerate mutase [Spirochaetota bacterium]